MRRSILKQVTLTLAVSLLMIFAMSISTFAADPVKYIDEKGEEATCEDYALIKVVGDWSGSAIGEPNGKWYYLDENKTFTSRLTVVHKAYLIVKDGCTLDAQRGIRVCGDAEFHIYSQSTGEEMGVIKADNSDNAEQAGIGGNNDENSGWIYINGCAITAKGGKYAAGIGGGNNGQGYVEINGGKIVEAKGGDYGAGIGSGDEAQDKQAGRIWINGGEISAQGGYDAAGIGGGNETAGGDIQIKGGTVTSAGGYFGAGIGGGDDGDAGWISITEGTVVANSGSVDDSVSSSTVGGAGIGGGRHGNAGEIKISGGDVRAKSGKRGAAIGSGGDNNSSSHKHSVNGCDGGSVEITGGYVEAQPEYNTKPNYIKNKDGGAGIGSGSDSYGVYVKITGGKIYAFRSFYDYTDYTIIGINKEYQTGESKCIGNGWSADSKGKVEIVNTANHPNLWIHMNRGVGATEGDAGCEVTLNAPHCRVRDPGVTTLFTKDKKTSMIYTGCILEACKHEHKKIIESTEYGHSIQCPYCDLDIKGEDHEFEWIHDNDHHWQKCKDCGYETQKVDHEYDPETGECKTCGVKGLKVEFKQIGGTGEPQIQWFDNGYKFKVGDPTEYGFYAASGTTFRGWKFGDYKKLFPVGEEETLLSDITVTAVYEVAWFDFKENVESLSTKVIKLENDIVAENVDEKEAAEANKDLMITIPEGHNVTIDLNGHKIDKNNRDRDIAEGETKTDLGIFLVKGTLMIKDSSEGATGTISGGNSLVGVNNTSFLDGNHGGAFTVEGGKLTLESGTITTNMGDAGGAVYVSKGSFNMTGGTIRENMGGRASAVCVGADGTFTMSGGTITENMSAFRSGVPAVQTEDNGVFTLGGKVEISNNRSVDEGLSDYTVSNVCPKEGSTVLIANTLDPESKIGIGTAVQLKDDQKVQITRGGKVTYAANFTSDNPAYQVVVQNDEAYLQKRVSTNPDAEISYKITVPDNIRGGKIVLDKTENVKSGDVINILAIPDDGYKFEHWSIKESSPSHVTIPSGGGSKASTSLTFEYQSEGEGNLKELEVTIRPLFTKVVAEKVDLFLVDGEDRTYVAPKTHIQAALGDTLQLEAAVTPENAGQDVVWTSSDPDHVAVDKNGKVTVKGPSQLPEITATSADEYANTTIYLSIAAVNTVTFDTDGGEGMNGEVYLSAGQKVAKPDDPVRSGEKFLGWKKVLEDGSLDADFYDFDSLVKSSFTLRAVWDHSKHTLTHVAAVAATCDQDGREEYWECSVCGHVFADAEGTNEVSLSDMTTTAEHKWGAWKPVKDADNNPTNYHERVCANDSSHVEKEKHHWNSGVSVVAPTSESEGQTKYTCDTCGETRIVTVPKLEEDEHSITINTEVEGDKDAVGGTVTGGKSNGKKGDKYTLKPKARRGYEFLYWLLGNEKYTDPYYNLEVFDSDIEVTAVFGEIAVERVEVFDGEVFLNSGETYSLYDNIKIYPSNALMPGLVWESSDANIATVDENGVVTAVSKGSAVITGTRDDGTELATITVYVDMDPDNPDQPDTPDTPDTPDQPAQPDKPAQPSANTNTKVGSSHNVSGNIYKIIAAGKVELIKAKNAKSVSIPATVRIGGKTYKVVRIGSRAFKAANIRTVTIGKNVKTLRTSAFSGSKATKLIVKTKKLTKKSVRISLKGSKVKTIQVKVGKTSVNKKYVEKYRKIFTKKNAGRKVTVR